VGTMKTNKASSYVVAKMIPLVWLTGGQPICIPHSVVQVKMNPLTEITIIEQAITISG